MLNALTFDVEEYFQVEAFRHLVEPRDWPGFTARAARSTARLLDVLDAHSVSATFFMVGWLAERHPELVREINGRGHELGCHGYAHRPIYSLSPVEFRADLRHAKQAIGDGAVIPLHGYQPPTVSLDNATAR